MSMPPAPGQQPIPQPVSRNIINPDMQQKMLRNFTGFASMLAGRQYSGNKYQGQGNLPQNGLWGQSAQMMENNLPAQPSWYPQSLQHSYADQLHNVLRMYKMYGGLT
jgi:hypothetical protein